MTGGEERTQRLGCSRSRIEEAELRRERRPGVGPVPMAPPLLTTAVALRGKEKVESTRPLFRQQKDKSSLGY